MKWFFILLLLGNVVYLGWEIDRDAQLNRMNISSAIRVPAGTQQLVLLNELEKLPETRSHIKLDNELSMESFNSEPVLAIALNPNTEQLMESLLMETSDMDNELEAYSDQEESAFSDLYTEELVSTPIEYSMLYLWPYSKSGRICVIIKMA